MKIDQALVNLLGDSSSKVSDSRDFSSKDNFKSTLDIVSNRSISNNTRDQRNQRDLQKDINNKTNDTYEPIGTRREKRMKETNYNSNETLSDSIKEVEHEEGHYIDSEDITENHTKELYNEQLYANIILAISEVLNLPEIDIESLFEELNITPNELNSSNLREFLQEVYDLESTIDLLDIPNISEILSNLNASLEEAYKNTENIKNDMIDKSLLGDAEVLLTEQNYLKDNIKGIDDEVNSIKEHDNNDDVNFINQDYELQGELSQGNQSNSNREQNPNNAQSNSNGIEIELKQYGIDTQDIYQDIQVQKNNIDISSEDNTEGQMLVSKVEPSTVFKVTPPKLQSTQNLIAKDIINQIQGKIKADIKGTVSEIRMLLKPENLGEISLKVITENGIVTAKILADNQRVKEIIESNLNELKQSLSENGIELSELSVSVGQDESSQRQLENFFKEQEKSKLRISQIVKNIMSDTEADEQDDTNNIDDYYDSSVNYTI